MTRITCDSHRICLLPLHRFLLDTYIIFNWYVNIVFTCFRFLHLSHDFPQLAIDSSKLFFLFFLLKSFLWLVYVDFILLWGQLLTFIVIYLRLLKRQHLLDAIHRKIRDYICPKLPQFIKYKDIWTKGISKNHNNSGVGCFCYFSYRSEPSVHNSLHQSFLVHFSVTLYHIRTGISQCNVVHSLILNSWPSLLWLTCSYFQRFIFLFISSLYSSDM